MNSFQHVVYFDNRKRASSATHQAIDSHYVELRKYVLILDEGRWE